MVAEMECIGALAPSWLVDKVWMDRLAEEKARRKRVEAGVEGARPEDKEFYAQSE